MKVSISNLLPCRIKWSLIVIEVKEINKKSTQLKHQTNIHIDKYFHNLWKPCIDVLLNAQTYSSFTGISISNHR